MVTDLDGDGDRDVTVGAASGVHWFRNDSIHQTACFVRQPDISTAADHASLPQVAIADVDGDGDPDALSAPMSDGISWHENANGLGSVWVTHAIVTQIGRPYAILPVDLDGDGDTDVVGPVNTVVTNFENVSGNGTSWLSTALHPFFISGPSLNAADLDRDGDQDVLVPYQTGNRLHWLEQPESGGQMWSLRTITTVFAPRFAAAVDVDRDGDPDVVASAGNNLVTWHENVGGSASSWTTHTISGPSTNPFNPHVLRHVKDVDGDGDMDLITDMNTELFWFENVAGGSSWVQHTVATSMFLHHWVDAGDVDGDGDVDGVAVDADVYVWYENVAGNGSAWQRHNADPGPQLGNIGRLADLDSDGDLDVVHARFFQSAVGWSRNDSGQVVTDAVDQVPPGVSNNNVFSMLRLTVTHGGRSGDSDAELARIGLLFEEGPGDPLTSLEANLLVEELRVYRDSNGNAAFDPGIDTLVTTVPTLALTAGVHTIVLPDGDPNLQVALGAPRTFFVVAQITANADQQVPNQFRVTHLALGPSATQAEDRAADTPLTTACPADVTTVMIGPVVPVELTRFTIE
jgi:hypothetical protein